MWQNVIQKIIEARFQTILTDKLTAASGATSGVSAAAGAGIGTAAGVGVGASVGGALLTGGASLLIGAGLSLAIGALQARSASVGRDTPSTAGGTGRSAGTGRTGTRGGTITAQEVNNFIQPTVVFSNGGDILVGSLGVTELGDRIGQLAADSVKEAIETGEIPLSIGKG